jgi:hypothetical protein
MFKNSSQFERAISHFDSIHHEDPETTVWRGSEIPRACLYHERLNYWVEQLYPKASEPLQLAARCQHLRRWAISRATYPQGLVGYRRWRNALTKFHVQEASSILHEVGYDDGTIGRVRDFLTKKNLKRDAETQFFEDAICLVFLETEFAEFADKHDRDRLIQILRKVWMKMSENGREVAQPITQQLSKELQDLLNESIAMAG